MFEIVGKYTKAKVMIDNLEESCVSQITSFVNHPAFTNPIAMMPDSHQGKSSSIGFTMPMTEKIIPNVIGVDISCAVHSFNIGNIFPITKELFNSRVRNSVPFGCKVRDKQVMNLEREFNWKKLNDIFHKFYFSYREKFGSDSMSYNKFDYTYFNNLCDRIGASPSRVQKSLGTLGGG